MSSASLTFPERLKYSVWGVKTENFQMMHLLSKVLNVPSKVLLTVQNSHLQGLPDRDRKRWAPFLARQCGAHSALCSGLHTCPSHRHSTGERQRLAIPPHEPCACLSVCLSAHGLARNALTAQCPSWLLPQAPRLPTGRRGPGPQGPGQGGDWTQRGHTPAAGKTGQSGHLGQPDSSDAPGPELLESPEMAV